MITFKKIRWKNFLSTGDNWTEINLNKCSKMLIIGENGSGKSTLLDAICFVLYGKPFRSIRKHDMINNQNGKHCEVEIEFNVSNDVYRIVRKIKPDDVQIHKNNKLIDKTAHVNDYQKLIENQILKINSETFKHIAVLGRSNFISFMNANAKQRRMLVESILSVAVYSIMSEVLKKRMDKTKENVIMSKSNVNELISKTQSQVKIIEELTNMSQSQIMTLNEKISANTSDIEEYKQEGILLAKEIKDKENNILSDMESDERKIEDEINKQKSEISEQQGIFNSVRKELEFFKNHDNCSVCKQEIDVDFKNQHIKKIEKKIADHDEFMKNANESIESLKDALYELETKSNFIRKEINQKRVNLETLRSKIKFCKNENIKMEHEINKLKNANHAIESAKKEKSRLAEEGKLAVQIQKNHMNEELIQKSCQRLLKDDGVKTQIIKKWLPHINGLINHYLDAMDAHLVFELDDEFNDSVKSRRQMDMPYSGCSEGEKMRIDLAILFAWRQIAKFNNSVNVNILFMDEIFDSSLDDNGTANFIKMMDGLENEMNIVVISHNKQDIMYDKFDEVKKFEKNPQGYSVIKDHQKSITY